MFKRTVDVVALIVLFHAEDVPGVEPAVSGMSQGKPLQELFRLPAQLQKGLPYRLKTIPYFFCFEVPGVLHLSAKSRSLPFMMSYKIEFGIVDHDLLVSRLDTQYVSNVARWHGVAVCFKLDKPLGVTNPQSHLCCVIGMKRQGLKCRLFLFHKQLYRCTLSGVMDMQI